MVTFGLALGYIPLLCSVLVVGLTILGVDLSSHDQPVSSNHASASNQAPATRRTDNATSATAEQQLIENIQKLLDENKQKIFEQIHPVGTATSAKLHDVTVTAWKHGQPTGRMEDVREFTIRYTLYWSGPVTKDGFTKVEQTYDTESERYTDGRILATNGVTNKDAESAAGSLFTTWLQYEAQKNGAEQAAREYYNR